MVDRQKAVGWMSVRITFVMLACALAGLSASAASAASAASQSGLPDPAPSAPRAHLASAADSTTKRHSLTLSLSYIGLGLEFNRKTGRQDAAGLACGLGTDCLFTEGIISSHAFAQPFLGGDTGREWPEEHGFTEILHLSAFYRYASRGRWQVDCGIRASGWWNGHTSGAAPGFLSIYFVPAVRWWRMRCGPRFMFGRFSYSLEEDGRSKREHALAIAIAPLTIRFDFTRSW